MNLAIERSVVLGIKTNGYKKSLPTLVPNGIYAQFYRSAPLRGDTFSSLLTYSGESYFLSKGTPMAAEHTETWSVGYVLVRSSH